MDENQALTAWPDGMLSAYGHMLSVNQVAEVLSLDPRIVRKLLLQHDPRKRLPGVKIGKSWRISRDQLRTYLLTHHNEDFALVASNLEKGTS
ncbi:helix-turn-helix domain-containing protein [Mycetocola zhujimingii]|uniref:helix-turn-helix domain-containing protein n=1 Tax=Mycetocola zhujimingii TaxID=2079792 RepID=UPI001F176EB0|nr:helix-turn-helix domain-containing protein [Mycetocola zhujimingii]